jgi:hypothetical protein
MADSSETGWRPCLGEQFIFGGWHYDLAKAKGLIKAGARPVEGKPLSLFKSMYYEAVKIDWDKAEKTAPSIPEIAATEEGGRLMLIDGWHRYAKALKMRQTGMPTVTLTGEETKQIRR